jgi:hypothetical protein
MVTREDLIATQGVGSFPAREGEVVSLDGIEAVVKAGSTGRQANQFSLRVDY